MRWLLGVVAVLVLTGTLSGVGATPAHAATPHSATSTSARVIEGEPWNGPAFPITCTGSTARISCSPKDVTEQPAPPAGTPAAVAWEALMGPDGEYAAAASYQAVIDKFGDVEPYLSIRRQRNGTATP